MTETATASKFGANGGLVAAQLQAAVTPLTYDDGMAARDRLTKQLCALGGEAAGRGARVRARVDRVIADAKELDWRAVVAIDGALDDRFGGDLAVNVAAGEPRTAARRLLLAALLWPAVHGANANPFAEVLSLARAGFSAEMGEQGLHVWRRGIDVPHAFDCPAPKPEGLILPG
jgi:fumarylacetoacetate (FAA) hydrolase family protein